MKKIKILAGGKIKNTAFQPIEAMYAKRIHLWSVQIQEVPDKGWERLTMSQSELWISLCQRGKMMDSFQLAKCIEQWIYHAKTICFLVGPSCGLPSSIMEKSTHTVSLSSMTWPHLMARSMLIEQIYRAQQHLKGHNYAFV